MSTDPYQILGIAKTASQDDIRKAYRKLAKRHHPDLNPGDKKAEEQFKLVSVAHDLLSDPEKRARFDRGEIDIHGQEQGFAGGRGRYQNHGDGAQGFRYSQRGGPQGNFSEEDLQDIFSMFGGGAGRGPFQQGGGGFRAQKGQDRRYNLDIDFLDAVNGTKSRITLPSGGELDVTIPSGIEDGQVLRLRGKGDPGFNNTPAGDALITIHVRSHAQFKREGRNIRLTWPMDLKTAILGGKITVPTPKGEVVLNVPAHSDTGNVLRLKGRGLPAKGNQEAGDLYVSLQVKIGKVDPDLEAFLKDSSDSDQK
ncbi:DnaJ-class molecular chaperone with C-terminal Zn finger domain (DnaJ) (PDB:1BQ0) [Commensalibacter communis]|uniref:J domain-containing protein n=1 Tax=Commensalibacter communis TaxID=2972786 RepID=UPI0022FF51D0|nr:J domain-containing protein [Commensalibacter communis]CAI3941223.1 DnaJ-class molecular chaperone with C-terminal Zn finger domain (DnaJ) (PDB:1BQ0) [Commensalibacter communis]CAI3942509.1 DnaJ-class molecular chaperone with C-terminal Zn finger domain (DnaJ) (PDB:1BQ0) [Commensalibacter communis]